MPARAKAFADLAPIRVIKTFSLATDQVNGNFWIADVDCEVVEISCSWDVPTSSGTLMVERLQGTEAPTGGNNLQAATVDTSAADDTVTRPALTTTLLDRRLTRGDRLGAIFTGTVSSGVALCVTVVLIPTGLNLRAY